MRINRTFLLFALFVITNTLCNGQSFSELKKYELDCITTFNNLKSAITLRMGQTRIDSEKNTERIKKPGTAQGNLLNDSLYTQKIIEDFFLVLRDNNDDTSLFGRTLMNAFNNFYGFFYNKNIDNIIIQPLRLSKDQYVFQKLTQFQQKNSFALIDKTDPEKILTYLLFIPGESIRSTVPRIMSWTLGYALGIYYYEDILGKKGLEFFFEGIPGPKNPIQRF